MLAGHSNRFAILANVLKIDIDARLPRGQHFAELRQRPAEDVENGLIGCHVPRLRGRVWRIGKHAHASVGRGTRNCSQLC